MSAAGDRQLAVLASRIAGRLVLDVARSGAISNFGVGRMISSAADRFAGDLDIERSVDALVAATAGGTALNMDDLWVRHWSKPMTALALVVDRSGSMSGQRLATAAIAAAACSYRVPNDWSALAFSDQILVLKSQQELTQTTQVVHSFLRLRGQGTTDLGGALAAAAAQLNRSKAKRKIVLLLSDCRATTGTNPFEAAQRLSELVILAPNNDAYDAEAFAKKTGSRLATLSGPSAIPSAIAELLS